MEWSEDVGAADWIVNRLHPFASDVGALIPATFDAYVRILHPARVGTGEGIRTVSWRSLAQRAGVPMHTTIDFSLIAETSAPVLESPRVGSLDPDELDTLVGILAYESGGPRLCWFAIWDGYGWLQGPPAFAQLSRSGGRRPAESTAITAANRVHLPGRSLALYRGAIEEAAVFNKDPIWQSPNLWWPDDHSWCVATEIDLCSTYVGGTDALAYRLLNNSRLEALPAKASDRIGAAGSQRT